MGDRRAEEGRPRIVSRVVLGHLRITGQRVLVGDPSGGLEEAASFALPDGRFPVVLDLVAEGDAVVCGRIVLIVDGPGFDDADTGAYLEPLDRVRSRSGVLVFVDAARRDAAMARLPADPLPTDSSRALEVEVDGSTALLVCGPGAGAYDLCWWYGEHLETRPFQDVVGVGVTPERSLRAWMRRPDE